MRENQRYIIICLLITALVALGTAISCFSYLYEKNTLHNAPVLNKFTAIFNEESIAGVNDCSNKAEKYFRYIEKDYDASVIVVRQSEGDDTLHAIVEIKHKFRKYYADPTHGTFSSKKLFYIKLYSMTRVDLRNSDEFEGNDILENIQIGGLK